MSCSSACTTPEDAGNAGRMCAAPHSLPGDSCQNPWPLPCALPTNPPLRHLPAAPLRHWSTSQPPTHPPTSSPAAGRYMYSAAGCCMYATRPRMTMTHAADTYDAPLPAPQSAPHRAILRAPGQPQCLLGLSLRMPLLAWPIYGAAPCLCGCRALVLQLLPACTCPFNAEPIGTGVGEMAPLGPKPAPTCARGTTYSLLWRWDGQELMLMSAMALRQMESGTVYKPCIAHRHPMPVDNNDSCTSYVGVAVTL